MTVDWMGDGRPLAGQPRTNRATADEQSDGRERPIRSWAVAAHNHRRPVIVFVAQDRPTMQLRSWPLFDALEQAQAVLIAGAGGGFDVYSGLPLYFALKESGKDVHLANLSFASLPPDEELRVSPKCVRITADTPYSPTYFPEHQLAAWFRLRHQMEVPVYSFPQTGVVPLVAAYRKLHELLALDAVVLVDGGTDSLMRGDEVGLGTPVEDATSMAAVARSGIPHQYLACIGFGVDTYHGVCHSQFLEAVADLVRSGAFLGVSAVLAEMPEGKKFLDAVDFANERTPGRQSIVANSIAASIEGHFGDHHRIARTKSSRLWINPLMPIYWAFALQAVVERNLYIDTLYATESMADVSFQISAFRGQCGKRTWDEIPL